MIQDLFHKPKFVIESKSMIGSTKKNIKFQRRKKDESSKHEIQVQPVRWFVFLVENSSRTSGACSLFGSFKHEPGITFLVRRTFKNFGYTQILDKQQTKYDSESLSMPKSKTTYKRFAIFPTFFDFFAFCQTIPKDEQEFHEIINDDAPIKPYFDLDFACGNKSDGEILIPDFKISIIESEVKVLAECARDVAKYYFHQQYHHHIRDGDGIPFQNNGVEGHEISSLVFSSNSDTKLSFHIIVCGIKISEITDRIVTVHRPSDAARLFCQQTIDRYYAISKQKKEVIKEIVDSIDIGIYKKLNSLRIVGSQKLGTGRTKILRPDLSISKEEGEDQIISSNYLKGVPDDLRLFAASLVTIVTDTLPITLKQSEGSKSLIRPKRSVAIQFGSSVQDGDVEKQDDGNFALSHEHAFEAFTEICAAIQEEGGDTHFEIRDQFSSFSIGEDGGVLIPLRIIEEYHCVVCDRTHKSENPYIIVNILTGLVLFNCRRSSQSFRIKIDSLKLVSNHSSMVSETVTISKMKECFGLANEENDDGFPIGASAVSDDEGTSSLVTTTTGSRSQLSRSQLSKSKVSLSLKTMTYGIASTKSGQTQSSLKYITHSSTSEQVKSVIESTVSSMSYGTKQVPSVLGGRRSERMPYQNPFRGATLESVFG